MWITVLQHNTENGTCYSQYITLLSVLELINGIFFIDNYLP